MTNLDLHPRALRRNIWRGLLSATDQEIRDGFDFYPGAHGLCRLFAAAHPPTTVSQIAGIYAELSPMNGWDTNVDNTLDILRRQWSATVNTSKINAWKALAIYHGSDPVATLRGRKITAFYRAINDPSDMAPIPIDRHLICLALGRKLDNNELSKAVRDADSYARFYDAYADLGAREGLGNRLASIAWFVQRRIARGQSPMIQSGSPVCCGAPMWSHGHDKVSGRRRWYCAGCRSTRRPEIRPRLIRNIDGVWSESVSDSGLPIYINRRGRRYVMLHPRHPYANSGGWQYLARFIIAEDLGYLPRSDEHTHHVDLNKANDDKRNLELLAVEYHGQIHASAICVGRESNGRFKALNHQESERIYPFPRFGPIIGQEALR